MALLCITLEHITTNYNTKASFCLAKIAKRSTSLHYAIETLIAYSSSRMTRVAKDRSSQRWRKTITSQLPDPFRLGKECSFFGMTMELVIKLTCTKHFISPGKCKWPPLSMFSRQRMEDAKSHVFIVLLPYNCGF